MNERQAGTERKVVSLMDIKSLKRGDAERDHHLTYVVRAGDTLETIAWQFFKNRNMKRAILSANDLSSPILRAGTTLRIPAVRQVPLPALNGPAVRDRKQGQIVGVTETYDARGGETLEEIAFMFYREPLFAYVIAVANNKPRGYRAQPGEKFTVPFKVVEVRAGESVFSIAERETGLKNYFMKLMMINRNIRPVAGDRLRVPPVASPRADQNA